MTKELIKILCYISCNPQLSCLHLSYQAVLLTQVYIVLLIYPKLCTFVFSTTCNRKIRKKIFMSSPSFLFLSNLCFLVFAHLSKFHPLRVDLFSMTACLISLLIYTRFFWFFVVSFFCHFWVCFAFVLFLDVLVVCFSCNI